MRPTLKKRLSDAIDEAIGLHIMTVRMTRPPRLRNVNESYENARLLASIGEETPREMFVAAVRDYAACQSHTRKAHLIEPIIRRSRLLAAENGQLPSDVKETLHLLLQAYRAFAPDASFAAPQTFAEAQRELQAIFF